MPQTTNHPKTSAARGFRWIIRLFSVLLTFLFVWLLGYLNEDLGRLDLPKLKEIREQVIGKDLLDREKELQDSIESAEHDIQNHENRLTYLKESLASSEQIMNRLLENQKLSLEKNLEPQQSEMDIFAASQKQFLENQNQYQTVLGELDTLRTQKQTLSKELSMLNKEIAEFDEAVRERMEEIRKTQQRRGGVVRISVIAVLLLVAVWLFARYRGKGWDSILYPFEIAVIYGVTNVIHDLFPSDYLRYVLLVAAIAAVVFVLITLRLKLARPRWEWLQKQYREYYQKKRCPTCGFPIQTAGGFSHGADGGKIVIETTSGLQREPAPYTCPACGTALFVACDSCGKIRHALLPVCEHCGKVHSEIPVFE